MSYTKNTWETGDVVTAAKLNNMENGIAAAGQMMLVHENYDEEISKSVLDKTWQEIHDGLAAGVVAVYIPGINEGDIKMDFVTGCYISDDGGSTLYYLLTHADRAYSADTANGYPVKEVS